jgi:hypothetical protein
MKLSILTLFRRNLPKAPTVSQTGIQARAIRHLIANGRIDAWTIIQMGTTDAHKMLTRMRRLGLLYDANDRSGHVLVRNRSGSGQHRVHRWTGKLPPAWIKTDGHVGKERRARVRGK